MARFMCRCVSGDFKTGFAIMFANVTGTRFKKIRLKRRSVFSYLPFIGRRRFRARHIESVQLLSQVNSTSMGAKAAAGIGGALILGPIGTLGGLLGARHSSEMQVLVTFKDGRSCVISGPEKGVSLLLQAGRALKNAG